MTPPPHHCAHESTPGEPLDIRFLARANGYEIAFIVPSPNPPPQAAAEPLVRLRFPGAEVEVVLTPAEFAALSADMRRLWEYLWREQARSPRHDT